MRSFYIISMSFRSSNTLHCVYCCIKTQTPLQCRTICSWLSRCSIRFSLWHHGYQAVMVDVARYRSKHLWSPLLGSLDQLHLSYVICIKRCIYFPWNKKALDRCWKISALKQVLCQEIDINTPFREVLRIVHCWVISSTKNYKVTQNSTLTGLTVLQNSLHCKPSFFQVSVGFAFFDFLFHDTYEEVKFMQAKNSLWNPLKNGVTYIRKYSRLVRRT